MPAPPGKTVTLRHACPRSPTPASSTRASEAPEIEQREAAEEEVAELLALAARVEGIVRNVGMHAGGVLIAPGKITDFCPLYMQPGSDSRGEPVRQGRRRGDRPREVRLPRPGDADDPRAREGVHPSRAGRTSADFALRDSCRSTTRGVYKLFSEGRTEAVFQFESRGMQRMLKDARPSRFEDLIALNAMFRPGPMENDPDLLRAQARQARRSSYPHPLLETVLGETYGDHGLPGAGDAGRAGAGRLLARRRRPAAPRDGQEEGRGDGQAPPDLPRRARRKKGIAEPKADEVFDLMEKFAGYGFNKSHAAAYALLAYHTAWLKVHYPAEFFAANMTVEMDDTDKLQGAARTTRASFGIDVRAARRQPRRVPLRAGRRQGGALRPGRGQGHRAGRDRGDRARRARTGGAVPQPVRLLRARRPHSASTSASVEALIKAGAFDALHADRADAAGQRRRWPSTAPTRRPRTPTRAACSTSATRMPPARRSRRWCPAEAWSIKERLTLEKAALGFYLSGHLFDQSGPRCGGSPSARIADLIDSREPQLLAGIVERPARRQRPARPVAIFKLDDKSDAIEAVANEELLDANSELLQGRRADHRAGQGAARPLLRRAAPERAARCGTWPRRAAASASTCGSR